MSSTNPSLTPELCHLFTVLVEQRGSLQATARELEQPVANLSKRLRPLLRGQMPEIPRPWLRKNGKRFELTEEGRIILPMAQEQVGKWRQFATFASMSREPGLTVACGQEAAGGIVLHAAKYFRRIHPKVPFKVAVVRGRKRIEGLATGLYDLALVTHSGVSIREIARSDVKVEALADDPLVLACGTRSGWATAFTDSRRQIALEELQSWPLILPEADSPIRKQFEERIHRNTNCQLTVAVEVGGWRVILGYVLAGFGIGLMPKSIVLEVEARLKWRPLSESLRPSNRVQIATLPVATNGDLVKVFVEGLKAVDPRPPR